MNYINEAIKKAIEAGYDNQNARYYQLPGFDDPKPVFLDPDFWECLGKSLGWSMDAHNTDGHLCIKCDANGWKRHWHQFIDHLTKRKEPAEFFKNILENNE